MVRTKAFPDSELRSLFLLRPESIRLGLVFYNVFGLDGTYKTNYFNLPSYILWVLLAIANLPHLHVTWCTMKKETHISGPCKNSEIYFHVTCTLPPSYFFTDCKLAPMEALESVFTHPCHILCVWQINNNLVWMMKKSYLLKTYQGEFNKLWNQSVEASSKHEYGVFLQGLQSFFSDKDATCFDWLADTWHNYTEEFIAHWAYWYLHFDNSAESSVEGSHSILKKLIDKSSYDLLSSFQHVKLFLKHRLTNVTVNKRSQHTNISLILLLVCLKITAKYMSLQSRRPLHSLRRSNLNSIHIQTLSLLLGAFCVCIGVRMLFMIQMYLA